MVYVDVHFVAKLFTWIVENFRLVTCLVLGGYFFHARVDRRALGAWISNSATAAAGLLQDQVRTLDSGEGSDTLSLSGCGSSCRRSAKRSGCEIAMLFIVILEVENE